MPKKPPPKRGARQKKKRKSPRRREPAPEPVSEPVPPPPAEPAEPPESPEPPEPPDPPPATVTGALVQAPDVLVARARRKSRARRFARAALRPAGDRAQGVACALPVAAMARPGAPDTLTGQAGAPPVGPVRGSGAPRDPAADAASVTSLTVLALPGQLVASAVPAASVPASQHATALTVLLLPGQLPVVMMDAASVPAPGPVLTAGDGFAGQLARPRRRPVSTATAELVQAPQRLSAAATVITYAKQRPDTLKAAAAAPITARCSTGNHANKCTASGAALITARAQLRQWPGWPFATAHALVSARGDLKASAARVHARASLDWSDYIAREDAALARGTWQFEVFGE